MRFIGVRTLFVVVYFGFAPGLFAQSLIPMASSTATTTTTVVRAASTTETKMTTASSTPVEATVRSYFADIPVMIAIARCESRFRQVDSSGALLDGGSGGMVGIFQINSAVHTVFAQSLGFDIATVKGNLEYARYLYDREGTVPWNSSASCWRPAYCRTTSSKCALKYRHKK
jgi:hypothetical protein